MSATSFQLISTLVRRETAMVYYDEAKDYLVEARLLPLAAAAGFGNDVDAYIKRVTVDPVERRRAVDALTINETSWYRDLSPYQAFTEHMLPRLLETRAASRHLRIWSAACSSGQEAYSIAMLLDQHLPAGWTAEILATDVSEAMVARVATGRYSQVEMNRGLPATSLVKYFTRVGSEWEVVPQLRQMVRARSLNLAEPFLGVGGFDVILLRNVLIYFEASMKYDILRRIHHHLDHDGYLLLGSTETTLDMPAHVADLWRTEPLGRVQAHRSTSSTPLASPIGA
ncbi:CheR family methyltransferase [Nocardioides sp. Kera G14]|uniref:CheR family methyltransferase n=1 Tax=Nocardioides sp. Kera G14 TaxID=2884264 RepID=UPI001D1183A2|nr:protein-glutamate O-methyltransferase CheR [Nocardioides sp. Kera G14]UDY25328.1 protein-glutamate O-methyltransferase CheR [Nocardioides sp. Kera G14]